MNRKSTGLVICAALAPALGSATVLYGDGSSHQLNNAVTESVLVTGATELRVGAGGSITGDGSNLGPLKHGALTTGVNEYGSKVILSDDASVTRGAEQYGISRSLGGVLELRGNSVVSGAGGTAIYGIGFTQFPNAIGLSTHLRDQARVLGHVETDGVVSLSGNASISGNLRAANSGINLFMDGGTIDGNVGTGLLIDHSALIHGGTISGSYGGGSASSLDFSMHGGLIDGGWRVNAQQLHVEMHGGRINGGMTFGGLADGQSGGDVAIFGGAIDAALGGWLFDFTSVYETAGDCGGNSSRFDIWGGQLGHGSAGNGIRLDHCASLDVYGTNLAYSGGWLTGLLADGSLLNLAITEGSGWGGSLRLHDVSVPEPGTLGLFGTALGALAFMRRRRAQPTA